MRIAESDLLQDLAVLTAAEHGEHVEVSVYGTTSNVCGTIRFTFPDAPERRRARRQLQRWASTDEPVSLLRQGDTITLFSEQSLLRGAFAAS